jgi:hypothetical protein
MCAVCNSTEKICESSARFDPLKGALMKIASPTRLACAIFLLTILAMAQGPSIPAAPATPKRPVTDEYQGVKVTDDYRWLENWDDPQVKQWSAAQNARSSISTICRRALPSGKCSKRRSVRAPPPTTICNSAVALCLP